MATASGSGPNPAAPTALSDEQAEQFAASFTPSWDTADTATDDAPGEATTGAAAATLVDAPAVAPAQAAVIVQAAPASPAMGAAPATAAPAFQAKQTLIGTAPPANAPAAGNGHDVHAAASGAASVPAPQTTSKGTQLMQGAPAQAKAQSRPLPAPVSAKPVAVNADPFAVSSRGRAARAHDSDDLDDFVPKKSSKTIYFVIAGLAVAAGLGLFLKFALTDDAPKTPAEQHATGPAATTAEIPPPPPKVDTPPPAATTSTAAAKVDPPPPPATLPAPQTARAPEPPPPSHAAAAAPPVRSEPRPHAAAPPPPPVAAAPPPAVTPKTPPKPANGSIVRDNPF